MGWYLYKCDALLLFPKRLFSHSRFLVKRSEAIVLPLPWQSSLRELREEMIDLNVDHARGFFVNVSTNTPCGLPKHMRSLRYIKGGSY